MELKEIGNLIKTQDNRITDQPLFIVERERISWGYDSSYCDDYKWVRYTDDYLEADEEMAAALDQIVRTYVRVSYSKHGVNSEDRSNVARAWPQARNHLLRYALTRIIPSRAHLRHSGS